MKTSAVKGMGLISCAGLLFYVIIVLSYTFEMAQG